jgi:uncharacterized coiled-coil protein SlyX
MTSTLDPPLAEVAAARERIAALEATLAAREATLEQLRLTVQQLSEDKTLLQRWKFGTRCERIVDGDESQLPLPDTVESPAPANATEPAAELVPDQRPKKRAGRGRRPRVFPDFLPRERREIHLKPEEIPAELRDNPKARRFFKKIGELLEGIPMQFKVIEQFQEVILLDQED